MKTHELILAVVPPALAILLQYFQLPSKKTLEKIGSTLEEEKGLRADTGIIISKTAKGAVSVAGIMPTLVSFFAAVTTIFFSENNGITYIFLCSVLCIAIGLVVIYIVTSINLFDLDGDFVPRPSFLRRQPVFFNFTWGSLIDYCMYSINGLLIIVAFSIFGNWLPNFD